MSDEPTTLYQNDFRFSHQDMAYDAVAYLLLGLTVLVATVGGWVLWKIAVHLWRWPRS